MNYLQNLRNEMWRILEAKNQIDLLDYPNLKDQKDNFSYNKFT